MMAGALLVGLLAGLGIVVFRRTVDLATVLCQERGLEAAGGGRWYLLLLPALGGLAVGLWVHALKPQGPGQGVAGIMESLAFHGGRVDLRGSIARIVGAVITLGSGGSAGPEDPSVQLGAAVGSQVGRAFRLSEGRVRTLVACGAAAALAAAFKAPLSGVFFAVEILLGEFSATSVSYIVVAAVAGAAASQAFLGSSPAFAVPQYELRSARELLSYFVLGCAAALVGVAYTRLLYWTEQSFEDWRFPGWLKPAIGGLAVGAIAFLGRPEVMGDGYATLGATLRSPSADVLLLLLLVVAKLVATTLTIGSGGQGGLFAPSLFLGAMLGLALGRLANAFFPAFSAPPAAYGMVAMGAVLASAVRAPIVAFLLPFEMTNDYRIILPLMLAVVTSLVVARWLERESVYTIKLKAHGIDPAAQRDVNIMRAITVGEAMAREYPTVTPATTLEALGELFHRTGHHGFPVLDEEGDLLGIVTLQDFDRVTAAGNTEGTVENIYVRDPITTFPDETLEEAVRRLGARDIGRAPVVDRQNPRRLLGVLSASDISRAYGRVLAQRTELRQRMAWARAGLDGEAEFVEIEIPAGAPAVGKRIQDLALPRECVLVSITRRGRTVIPRGGTVLRPGDVATAFVAPSCRPAMERALAGRRNGEGT